jgi:hypothetical protein
MPDAAPASSDDDEHVLADSPPPLARAAPWRHRLFARLHTRRAHIAHLVVISLDILLNLAGLMLSLFTCRTRHEELATSAKTAEAVLRWTSVGLLGLMLQELLARAVAVGPLRFFRIPLHVVDAAILAGLLGVEAGVSDRVAEEAAGLLVVVRLARVLRLLSSMHDYASDRRKQAEARARELEQRVRELEGALQLLRSSGDGDAKQTPLLRDGTHRIALL